VKARHDEGDGEVVVIDSCVTVSRRFLWVTFLERKLTLESRFRKLPLGARRGGRPLCETEKPRYRVYPTFPSRPCHSRESGNPDGLRSGCTPVIRLCCNTSMDAVSGHGMTKGMVTGCRVKAQHDEGDGEVVAIDSCVTVSRRFLWVTFLERKLPLKSRFRKLSLRARRRTTITPPVMITPHHQAWTLVIAFRLF